MTTFNVSYNTCNIYGPMNDNDILLKINLAKKTRFLYLVHGYQHAKTVEDAQTFGAH